jgi:hypothetical protein
LKWAPSVPAARPSADRARCRRTAQWSSTRFCMPEKQRPNFMEKKIGKKLFWIICHHVPTLTLEHLILSKYLTTYLDLQSLFTRSYIYPK